MIFISILTLIVAKALPFINSRVDAVFFTRIASLVFLFSGILSFNTLYFEAIGSGLGLFNGLFHITLISQLIEVFLLIIASLILIAWPLVTKFELNNESGSKGIKYSTDYSLIVLFSTLGSCLLVSSSDLISIYLSIELQSFGLYILATLYRDSESSTSAGLKYFLLGGLSSCFILLGAGIIYSYSGLTNLEALYSLISVSELNFVIQGISVGFIIIFIGFLFKIAAAPLHNWSPDVYDDVPTIVTIWLTIMPKIAILILLLELHTQIYYFLPLDINLSEYFNLLNISNTSIIIGDNISNLLLISSLLSLIIGTIVGLSQTKIKRLLAYSTISHIGFILLALAINTEQSIDSLIFYIIQYSITNLNIFLIIIALSYVMLKRSVAGASAEDSVVLNKNNILNNNYNISDIKYISDLKGQFFNNPILSLCLVICLFSMAGIPPLMGFFSKQFVLYSALQNGYNFISLIAIISSVISASYYLKIIKVLHTETLDNKSEIINNFTTIKNINSYPGLLAAPTINLTNFHSYLISALTLLILLFILKPSLILNSTQLLSLSLFYN